jgi:hypothetical protein
MQYGKEIIKMGFMGRKSKLSSKTISKVWLNKKDYKFQDFDFKIEPTKKSYSTSFNMLVYNCGGIDFEIRSMGR